MSRRRAPEPRNLGALIAESVDRGDFDKDGSPQDPLRTELARGFVSVEEAAREHKFPLHPRPQPEDDPNLSPEQRAMLEAVKALTTPEALELLSEYQRIELPEHRASVRKLARILAEISRQQVQSPRGKR